MSEGLCLPYSFDKRLMDTQPVWMLWRNISCLSPDSSVFLLVAHSLYGMSWRVQQQISGLGSLSSTRLHSVITHAPRHHENRITFSVKSKLQDIRSLKRLYIAHLRQECHKSKFGIFWGVIVIERNVRGCTFNSTVP